jgi:collagenase-like PrtC family protease
MKLVVPAVFENRFLEALAPIPVSHLYGTIGGDLSLRPQRWLPQLAAEELAEFVSRVRQKGLQFFYCLNVACLANREFTAEGQRWIVERLGWLDESGVEGVVLANPYLIAFAHKRFPRLQIAASTACAIDSVDKALFYQSQGADVLYLPEFVNRDFQLLAQLRKRVRARIVLLANVGCLLHCPIRQYHINVVSHSKESLELGTYVDYPLMCCTGEKVRDSAQMVKATWIRPEDVAVYEEIGIDEFKLAGREMERKWVERVAGAFAARRYDGDLNDLVLGFDHLEPFGRIPVRIPNRAMEGFIDFFRRKHDCRLGCNDCHYCEDWAARVCVEDKTSTFLGHLNKTVARLEAGAFRTLNGS